MYTWRELVALYRIHDKAPPSNLQPRYNICPTTQVDAVVFQDGERMRDVKGRWRIPVVFDNLIAKLDRGLLNCPVMESSR
jgi:putative SOS response-associated peptidase YedK